MMTGGEPTARPASSIGRRLRSAAPLAAVAFLYLYFVPYFRAVNNPNENTRVFEVRAVVDEGRLDVDGQLRRWGMINDLAARDGHYYSSKAPGTTFVGVPVYGAYRVLARAAGGGSGGLFETTYALRLFGTLLPTLVFLALFRRHLARIAADEHVANALTIATALGTTLLPCALVFVNHSLSAATACGAVLAADAAARAGDAGRPRRIALGWFAVAGFLLSFTAALDFALLPVAVALLVYVLARAGLSWRRVAAVVAGALVPALLTAAYNWACWGGPFRLAIDHLANPEFAAGVAKGRYGIVGPTKASVWGLLLSAKKGLFFFSPLLAAGLVAAVVLPVRERVRREALLIQAIVVWVLLYGVSIQNWHGGWVVGPRYVTVIVPFLVLALALGWAELPPAVRRWFVPPAVGLAAAGILMVAPAAVLFPHLPEEHANPVFDLIWPLWRDGFTPHSLGRWAFGWSGRADQLPFLAVLAALLGYLAWIAGRQWRFGRRPWLGFAAGVGCAAAVASGLLWLQSRPVTAAPDLPAARANVEWVRYRVWEPPVAPPRPEPASAPADAAGGGGISVEPGGPSW
jgi:energy-coupling factor transporter transmembrane protein EcfT